MNKGALYAGQFQETTNLSHFNQVIADYLQASNVLNRKYLALYKYLFASHDHPQPSSQNTKSKQMRQLDIIKNIALLAFLESSINDFEIFSTNNTKPLFNSKPIFKYTKPLPFQSQLFVLEPNTQNKHYLIERYLNLEPLSYTPSNKSSQQQIKETITQIEKIFNFSKHKQSFMIVGPSIETSFKLLLITYSLDNNSTSKKPDQQSNNIITPQAVH